MMRLWNRANPGTSGQPPPAQSAQSPVALPNNPKKRLKESNSLESETKISESFIKSPKPSAKSKKINDNDNSSRFLVPNENPVNNRDSRKSGNTN